MKLFILALTLSLFLLNGAFAQRTSPTPPPADDDEIVKISTDLIQIDVTVTDRDGNIVKDIKPGEIEIYENGEKQEISNFSFISNVKEAPATPGNVPVSTMRAERVKRTIALVIDDFGLAQDSIYQARRAVKKFVDEQMKDGDIVAIIRASSGSSALQQFTNDKRLLYAAIEKIRFNPYAYYTLGTASQVLAEKSDRSKDDKKNDANDTVETRENIFENGTLGAVNYVVRGMQEMPGRKSILLISDGFVLYEGGETTGFGKYNQDSSSFKETSRQLDGLRTLLDLASRSSVVINTMDAGGLRPSATRQQEGLRFMAKQTGGIAILNENNLAGGIRKVLDDQSYYLVGYTPSDETFDANLRRFNKLEVKVTRPGLVVRYRSGFFSVAEEKLKRKEMTYAQSLINALKSPFGAADITVSLNALFNPSSEGSSVRMLLHVQARDLTFTDEPDGTKKVVFEVVAASYNSKALPVEKYNKVHTLYFKKTAFESVLRKGFVKKPGAYQIRVALADIAAKKIGSASQFIEVPNLEKDTVILSGVILDNIPFEVWKKRQTAAPGEAAPASFNPLESTSTRRFKLGSILNYGFSILNAKLGPSGKPDLAFQMKIIRDGKPLLEGQKQPVPVGAQTRLQDIPMEASLDLGDGMEIGDYVLQIEVTDNLAKGKRQVATQFVQFEIVE